MGNAIIFLNCLKLNEFMMQIKKKILNSEKYAQQKFRKNNYDNDQKKEEKNDRLRK